MGDAPEIEVGLVLEFSALMVDAGGHGLAGTGDGERAVGRRIGDDEIALRGKGGRLYLLPIPLIVDAGGKVGVVGKAQEAALAAYTFGVANGRRDGGGKPLVGLRGLHQREGQTGIDRGG